MRHSRKRVGLETEQAAILSHAKIDASVAAQFQCLERSSREVLGLSRSVRGNLCRKDFFGHPHRVLAFVVVDLVLRYDLADGKRILAENPDGQLSPRHELLDHDFVVEPEGFGDGGTQLLAALYYR